MSGRILITLSNMGPPPFPLEHVLRDATAAGGAYHGNFGRDTSVIVDYPFITGRNTPDSTMTGQKIVEVLDDGLRRWGFDDHGRPSPLPRTRGEGRAGTQQPDRAVGNGDSTGANDA